MMLRIDTHVRVAGVVSHIETQYKIASISPTKISARGLLKLSRGHWGVENKLHFIKDRWWDEDRQWSLRPGLAERLAMLRDSALTALRVIPGRPDDEPIRGRADHLGRNMRKALRFIGALS
jgi:predicted transposase YbfD/YdcC